MGCHMQAALETTPDGKNILEKVPTWFEEWEQILSRFRPESELNRLNNHPGLPLQVSEPLWDVLQLSQKMYRKSNQLVTPVVLDALELAGYDRSFEQVFPVTAGYSALPPLVIALDEIEMSSADQTVTLPPGMRLDLGGVAKGWAAQQAMLRLRPYGSTLVDAGGDIALSGALSTGEGWPVSINDPLDEAGSLALLQLRQAGIATSGKDYRRWKQDGKWYHHIIDPRTGLPAQTDLLTVSVIAPDVTQAEMAAKTVFILGLKASLEWLNRHSKLAALLVLQEGSRQQTAHFQSYLWNGGKYEF